METVLIPHVREPNGFTLDFYLKHGGYDALKAALSGCHHVMEKGNR